MMDVTWSQYKGMNARSPYAVQWTEDEDFYYLEGVQVASNGGLYVACRIPKTNYDTVADFKAAFGIS